ncbi:unnamed protein product, partial [Mesorhabditis belari]|uniref:Uncharacterized protein n=1 Tax=Mesorhabditis belari TaxID=2138241 RepID=A0AAF3J6S2_9BILA
MEEEKCATCRDLEKLSNLSICETNLLRENPTNKAFYTKNQISKATICENCQKDHPWNCTHTKALKFKHTNTKNRIETIKMLPKKLTDLMVKIEEGIRQFAQTLEMEIQSAEQITDPIEMNQKCNLLENKIEEFTQRFEQFEQFPEFFNRLTPSIQKPKDEMTEMVEKVALSSLEENLNHEKYRDSTWDLGTHLTKDSSRHPQIKPPPGYLPSYRLQDICHQSTSDHSSVTGSDLPSFREDQWSKVGNNREKLVSPHTSGSETPTNQTHPSFSPDEIQYTAAPPINYDYINAAYQLENAIRKRWHIKIWGLNSNGDEITFRIENKSETPMLIKFEQWTPGMIIRFKGSNDYQEKKEYRRAFELPAHKSEVVKIMITDRVRKSLDEYNKAPFVRFHGIGQLMGTRYNFVVRTINCNLEKDQWKPVEI